MTAITIFTKGAYQRNFIYINRQCWLGLHYSYMYNMNEPQVIYCTVYYLNCLIMINYISYNNELSTNFAYNSFFQYPKTTNYDTYIQSTSLYDM